MGSCYFAGSLSGGENCTVGGLIGNCGTVVVENCSVAASVGKVSYDAEKLANDSITGVAAQNIPETAEELVVSDSISGLNFYGASLVYRDL